MEEIFGRIIEADSKFKDEGSFIYGTSGFRTEGCILHRVTFRCILALALRSNATKQYCGIMITASHNPADDNGIKLIDSNGEVVDKECEAIAMEIVNAPDLKEVLQKYFTEFNANILMGYDTRKTSPELADAAKACLDAIGANYKIYPEHTTPHIHWLVKYTNETGQQHEADAYWSFFEGHFRYIMSNVASDKHETSVMIDCSDGVGGAHTKVLAEHLSDIFQISYINADGETLNENTGAEFVHKVRKFPKNYDLKETKSASLDGDADRVVYFMDHNNEFVCLDGDRLIVLYVTAVKKLLEGTGINPGVVTTVYANSSVVTYIQDTLQCEVVFTGTGVKNMHPAAAKMDVGVYFESNGHGTLLFKPEVLEAVRGNELAFNFLSLSNITVGDALVDVLLAEASLRILNFTIFDWLALYTDTPAKTTATKVKDRAHYVATPDERKLAQPESLATKIYTTQAEQYPEARTVVRASGTEPIVRVYAEASTQERADALAQFIVDAIAEFEATY